jgi:TetR/AcrR family transcriptional repressor of mexJK operon
MTTIPKRQQNRMLREQRILDSALKIFADKGFVGASMDDIAAEAGISKPTLYQYFSSKDELFTAMMSQERDHMLESFEYPSAEGMVAELYAFSWHYAEIVLRPEMLNLARLIISEAQRLPEIGRAYQSSGPDRVLAGMMRYLEGQRDAGRLVFDDAELAAEDLWGLILSAPTFPMQCPIGQRSNAISATGSASSFAPIRQRRRLISPASLPFSRRHQSLRSDHDARRIYCRSHQPLCHRGDDRHQRPAARADGFGQVARRHRQVRDGHVTGHLCARSDGCCAQYPRRIR